MTVGSSVSAVPTVRRSLVAGAATPGASPLEVHASAAAGAIRQPIQTSLGITIRLPVPGDRASYLAALRASRAQLEPWFPLNEPGETDEAYVDRQIAQAHASEVQRTDWRRCAFTPDGSLVGVVNINRITRTDTLWHATINWWVSMPMTGRGVATEMVARALDHAFKEIPGGLQLDLIHAEINDANHASARLAKRLGFVSDPLPSIGCEINGQLRLQTIWTIRRPADVVVHRARHTP